MCLLPHDKILVLLHLRIRDLAKLVRDLSHNIVTNRVILGPIYSPTSLRNILVLVLQIFLYLEASESNTTSDWLNHMTSDWLNHTVGEYRPWLTAFPSLLKMLSASGALKHCIIW